MKRKITICCFIAFISLLLAVAVGSVFVHPAVVVRIIIHKTIGLGSIEDITGGNLAIIWNLRLPRALLAFIVGAMLSVSGAIMQSVLRNPLASSFTLGVSSGASLGAVIVIFTGLTILPNFTLPLVGFFMGMAVMMFSITFASKIDGMMENNTIILMGMVTSLFINALTTLLMALQRESIQSVIFWQMGSFSMRDWSSVLILAPLLILGVLIALRHNQELDISTFGEDSARTIGVNMRFVKWILLITAAALTGSAIAFVGIIGFVDLVAPHIVRKLFGARHIVVIPLSAVLGGSFMVLADLAARTVTPPAELPIGVVTALIGAPFFAYIYFAGRRGQNA